MQNKQKTWEEMQVGDIVYVFTDSTFDDGIRKGFSMKRLPIISKQLEIQSVFGMDLKTNSPKKFERNTYRFRLEGEEFIADADRTDHYDCSDKYYCTHISESNKALQDEIFAMKEYINQLREEIRTNNLPEVGLECKFFDDGKLADSRTYDAVVKEVVKFEDIKDRPIKRIEHDDKTGEPQEVEYKFGRLWRFETLDHDWIYAPSTDYIVVCSIPDYDKDDIYFTRDIYGGWFSMEITASWQAGSLDVDGSIYKRKLKEEEEWKQEEEQKKLKTSEN